MDVNFINNSEKVLAEFKQKVNQALSAVGESVEGHAKDNCPVDTGRLRASIGYNVQNEELFVGTNVEYAPYVEYGTGIYAEEGGRGTPWGYQDEKGEWHYTHGQKPTHFLRNTQAHSREYENIIETILKKV